MWPRNLVLLLEAFTTVPFLQLFFPISLHTSCWLIDNLEAWSTIDHGGLVMSFMVQSSINWWDLLLVSPRLCVPAVAVFLLACYPS